jgi:hypothetical protein
MGYAAFHDRGKGSGVLRTKCASLEKMTTDPSVDRLRHEGWLVPRTDLAVAGRLDFDSMVAGHANQRR